MNISILNDIRISDTYYDVSIARKTYEMFYHNEFPTRLISILYAPKISYVGKAGWLDRYDTCSIY